MRRVLFVTAAVVAAVIFFALATLPPRPLTVDASGIDPDLVRRTVRGAYHIHTSRSDGASDKATIAAAAARAGLQFVILTDHGDATLPPDPPEYLSGVLCIDGVEISTNGGHYVALGMHRSPYPLGGEPSAVVEDVRRLGGFGIAAHPDSPKASLAWTDWDAPIDGIEWLNADSEWRDESLAALGRVFLHYLFRPGPALASMLDRPVATLKRWDELTRRRPVVALAAHDAHGGIGRGVEESGVRKQALGHVPSYEASFRTFSDNVILDARLSGSATDDGRRLLDAIRDGRVFTVIDAIASPGYVDLRGYDGSAATVKVTLPAGAELWETPRGVARRIEVRVPGSPGSPPVPWLLSNPVFSSAPTIPPSTVLSGDVVTPPRELDWRVEKDSRSTATLTAGQQQAAMHYTLAPGARTSQFVALAGDLKDGEMGSVQELVFSAFASGPIRVSVQLRYAGRGGERWGSSVYVDSNPRDVVVALDRMRPLDRQTGQTPDPATASSLLFVVDLTNAKPGDSNTFSIGNLRIAR